MAEENQNDKEKPVDKTSPEADKKQPVEAKEPQPEKALSAVEQEAERLLRLEEARARQRLTDRLEGNQMPLSDILGGFSSRLRAGTAEEYIPLPLHMLDKPIPDNVPLWRIELHGLPGRPLPLGLDLFGDTVLGRSGDGSFKPDLDMDKYNGFNMGISRRHALLRPTVNRLYIIDLGSTNGTMRNALLLGKGVAQSVEHGDSIVLGRMAFTIHIIDGPGMYRDQGQKDADAAGKGQTGRLAPDLSSLPAPSDETSDETLIMPLIRDTKRLED